MSLAPKSFNPRARAGRDAAEALAAFAASCFNPRARAGRDTRLRHRLECPYRFNPRARAGRDLKMLPCCVWYWLFQSTRPRGARRDLPDEHLLVFQVSIHAPARGATVVT